MEKTAKFSNRDSVFNENWIFAYCNHCDAMFPIELMKTIVNTKAPSNPEDSFCMKIKISAYCSQCCCRLTHENIAFPLKDAELRK